MKRFAAVLLLIVGCAGVPGQANKSRAKIPVTFRAAVIKNNGEQVPVARISFAVRPYLESEVKQKAVEISKPGPSPAPVEKPAKEDPNYLEKIKKWNDYDSSLEAWEAHAYSTLAEAELEIMKSYSNDGFPTVSVKTDLDGKASIDLPQGDWFVSGSYKLLDQTVTWSDVGFVITPEKNKIELSNDNGKITPLPSS